MAASSPSSSSTPGAIHEQVGAPRRGPRRRRRAVRQRGDFAVSKSGANSIVLSPTSTVVSCCPTSSCRSRAMRARSSSCSAKQPVHQLAARLEQPANWHHRQPPHGRSRDQRKHGCIEQTCHDRYASPCGQRRHGDHDRAFHGENCRHHEGEYSERKTRCGRQMVWPGKHKPSSLRKFQPDFLP